MGKKSDLGEFEPDVVVGGRLAGLSISKYCYPVVHRSMEIPNMFCEGKCAVDVEEGCGGGGDCRVAEIRQQQLQKPHVGFPRQKREKKIMLSFFHFLYFTGSLSSGNQPLLMSLKALIPLTS